MWGIENLKKGVFVNINGEIYEVASQASRPLHQGNKPELTFELFKMGDRQASPNFRLVYVEGAETIRFEVLDKKEGSWKEKELNRFGF